MEDDVLVPFRGYLSVLVVRLDALSVFCLGKTPHFLNSPQSEGAAR